VLLLGVVVVFGSWVIREISGDDGPGYTPPRSERAERFARGGPVTQEPDPARATADEWLAAWSGAHPETSFGTAGSESVEASADWAEGPRYWVHAGGRRVLLYYRDSRVVGALLEDDTGFRTRLCHEADCYP
jgi:hypothetical protein